MKKITILGSTGSIGTQALEVVSQYPLDLKVFGLSCNSNIDLLIKQIKKYKPQVVAIKDESQWKKIREQDLDVVILLGDDASEKLAAMKCDLVLNSLVGIAGLLPTMAAIKAKNNIALANKETLVAGGELVKEALKDNNVELYPVDSEHSAIWQCLDFDINKEYESLILTASGGAFRDLSKSQLEKAKAVDALKHPTWDMGAKVTIDSATLMNKGLEVIEAMHLFNKKVKDIEILIHKQSIIHSMIRYKNGSTIAQISYPDMKLPIQLALLYPKKGNHTFSKLDYKGLNLTFDEVDYEKFPCLKIAKEVALDGGLKPTVMNAANEILVQAYLKDLIKFYDIPYYINKALDEIDLSNELSLESIIDADLKTRNMVKEYINW